MASSIDEPVFSSNRLDTNDSMKDAQPYCEITLSSNNENICINEEILFNSDKNDQHNSPNSNFKQILVSSSQSSRNSKDGFSPNDVEQVITSRSPLHGLTKDPLKSSNRKRKLEENENQTNKRISTSENSDDAEVYFKLLIPSICAGGVIGRKGEKIAQIQKDSNVKMKMSKTNDFYPNTCERICLIMGFKNAVLKAYEFILERMQEKCQPESSVKTDPTMNDRLNQVMIMFYFAN